MLTHLLLAVALSATPGPSVHAQAAAEQHLVERQPTLRPADAVLARGRQKAVVRVVYGYYRGADPFLANVRWEALTHLAWFSIGVDQFGNVSGTGDWPDTVTVQAAHDANVRVDLTFTLFDSAAIATLCGNSGYRSTAITNMVDLMEQGNADGISVDFETPVGTVWGDFQTFIEELRTEMDDRGLGGHEITIAGPAVDWSGDIDLAGLLDYADYYFIMGYGFFWSGSARAGPSGLLRITPDWAPYVSRSALRSIADFSALLPAHKRRQIIYGVPWYGIQWSTDSGDVGAQTTAFEQYRHYRQAREDLDAGQTRQYHTGIQSPWYSWQDGTTWHQVWYEDEESLSHKYRLALDQDLAGVGMWVIDSAGMYPELWDGLESALSVEPSLPLGHRGNPIPITDFPFHDERDTSEGPSNYFNYYSCSPNLPEYGREWVYRLDLCQPGILAAHVPEHATVDPDLHLLSAPDQDACLQRAHLDLSATVTPGQYLLTVDTWVDSDGVELEGPYELDVTFTPAPGSEPCATHLTCDAGACVCEGAGETDCSAACADLQTDSAHCGGCNSPCAAHEICVAGSCVPEAPAPDGGVDAGDASELPCCNECRDGCGGCRTAEGPGPGPPVLLLLILGLVWRHRRSGER